MTQPKSQFVRKGRHEQWRIAHTSQHRPFLKRLMFWGCFSNYGLGKLLVIQGTMNGIKYKTTIEQALVPQIEEWFPEGQVIFQHDNAPCHKCALVRQYLETCNFEVMVWPPYSPDLNPIENLWAILKQRVHKTSSSNIHELENKLKTIWETDPAVKASCTSLIESMPRRVEACIAAKGGPLKY